MLAYIQNLSKAELHLHIEGTLEPEMMFVLAERNKIKLPYSDVTSLKKAYNFANLQDFLNLYYQGMQVLQTEEDFYDLTYAYLQKAKDQNIRHVELFFDPQAHLQRNLKFATVINGINEALITGKKELEISSHIILCFLRDLSADSAIATLNQSLPFKQLITGIGLDSAEMDNPPEKFKEVFQQGIAAGYLPVAHAGEEGSSKYIWQALDLLKAKRIDHGVRCIEDPKLVERLVQEKIPLTMCPLSNKRLQVCPDLTLHPLKNLLSQGACVTINSDDPAYFGGYVVENYAVMQTALNLTKEDLKQIAINSFTAAFIAEEMKNKYIAEILNYTHHE